MYDPTMSDENILDAIEKDTETGFHMLLRQYKEPVYWHIRRITVDHHAAEDALQETFLRVFRNIRKIERDMSVSAWIFRIATNEALRMRRQLKIFENALDCSTQPEALSVVADEYCDYSDLEAVRLQKAIGSLPPKQQLAFNLRYYNEFDYATIAKIMESTAASAKACYHIAKEKIIHYMNTHD